MLAGPILLEQLTEYTGISVKGKRMTVYSDNEGLITRGEKGKHTTHATHLQCYAQIGT